MGATVVAIIAAVVDSVRIVVHGDALLLLVGVVLGAVGALIAGRWSWLGLLLAVAGTAVTAMQAWDPTAEWTIVVFVLFAITLRGAPPVRGIIASAFPVYFVVSVNTGGFVSPDALAGFAACIAGGAAGAGIRSQQRYWESLRAHAREAIATRDAEASRRVDEERLRIARDLHDVVGHQIAVASMHLGAVEVTVHNKPDAAARAAAEARKALRAVTGETQQILELLRSRDRTPDHTVAGLASLPALIASFEALGLDIRSDISLPTNEVVPMTGMTVYRVTQEALTNAHRYGAGHVTLSISNDGSNITVVARNGRSTADDGHGSGFGLIGMRERVAAAGGSLDVEDDEANFTVRASIPIKEATR
ncbi:histidine kinase [Curtobacterium sp. MCPF17_050]|uniref:sensor histidine kinase n=1 Tax=Curtobacterium sp. MCPF17_050 TaxID=2175664 RepID=UPI0015E8DB26|nr:histidine kinase [Curtobacterium sp. MCPF17_050]WIB15517.1 histidine kinase [Curtobacterium sp. MCPF17_050]